MKRRKSSSSLVFIIILSIAGLVLSDKQKNEPRKPKCQCHKGEPVVDRRCPASGGNKCKSCHPGYSLLVQFDESGISGNQDNDIKICLPDHCFPSDEYSDEGSGRGEFDWDSFNGSGGSAFKDKFYSLVDRVSFTGKCKVCHCENGIPAIGNTCDTDGIMKCETCNDGYEYQDYNGTCKKMESHQDNENNEIPIGSECRCTFGVGAISGGDLGMDKPCKNQPGFENCALEKCFPGYHNSVVDDVCERNYCLCGNGIEAVGKECIEHLGEICDHCLDGYELINKICVALLDDESTTSVSTTISSHTNSNSSSATESYAYYGTEGTNDENEYPEPAVTAPVTSDPEPGTPEQVTCTCLNGTPAKVCFYKNYSDFVR